MKISQINIANEIGELIVSRDSVRLIFDKINKSITNKQITQVHLDFKGVHFISRAAAHEFNSNNLHLKNNNYNVVIKNMNLDLKKMLNTVELSSSKSKNSFLTRHYVSSSKEFNSLLAF